MEVKLLSYTSGSDKILSVASKAAMDNINMLEVYNENTEENIRKDIKKAIETGNYATLEHVMLNFAAKNISSIVETYLINNKLAAFALSQDKNVDITEEDVYIPEFRFSSYLNDEDREKIKEEYKKYIKYTFDEYRYLLENGIPKEDARYVLPYSITTNVMFSLNIRELIRIIDYCLTGDGSKYDEISAFGVQLLDEAKDKFKEIFPSMLSNESKSLDKHERLEKLFTEIDLDAAGDRSHGDNVELLSYDEAAEQLVGMAALINNFNMSTHFAQIKVNDTDILKEVLDIVCREDRSKLEVISYTFRINNITMPTLKNIMRHRMQSLLTPDFIHVGKSNSFIMPRSVEEHENKELAERYKEVFEEAVEFYNKFVFYGIEYSYMPYLFLQGDQVVDVITTMSAKELYDFLGVRLCERANWEVRDIAEGMHELLKEVAPFIFSRIEPECSLREKCTELDRTYCPRS